MTRSFSRAGWFDMKRNPGPSPLAVPHPAPNLEALQLENRNLKRQLEELDASDKRIIRGQREEIERLRQLVEVLEEELGQIRTAIGAEDLDRILEEAANGDIA